MIDKIRNGQLIITSIERKKYLLKKLAEKKEFYDIKIMTKQEFFSYYYFSFNDTAIAYLREKYHYDLNICKLYLDHMYIIDDKKNYQSKKLQKLKELKKELQEAALLEEKPYFLNYLKKREIILYQVDDLEKYERVIFQKLQAKKMDEIIQYPLPEVIHYAKDIEEELVYLATTIRRLKKEGVSFSKIHLINVTSDYIYPLTRIFKKFQIPHDNIIPRTLYGCKAVDNYLKTGELPQDENSDIREKLIEIMNKLTPIKNEVIKKELIIDYLKRTSLKEEKEEERVHISSLEAHYEEEDYVFVIGLNQDIFPKPFHDDDFILDAEKKEVELYTTDQKNEHEKEKIINQFKHIKNLTLSGKAKSPFDLFYPSNFIEELGIKQTPITGITYNYSNQYNQLLLAEKCDDYFKWGKEDELLFQLYSTYPDINYHTFHPTFSGIEKKKLQTYLGHHLTLSYTHLQDFYLCQFRYYINHILKLNPFEDNFAASIGTMFHEALKYMDCEDFDLDLFIVKFLNTKSFTPKEEFFIQKLKKELKKTLDCIEEQKEYTKFKNRYVEYPLTVKLPEEQVEVILKGTIDKILYYKNIADTYYAVIDYKSGYYDTNLKKIEFGLNMQLPIYLYLIEKSTLFTNPIFTGFYYQKIIPSEKKYGEEETLKLDGYSCDQEDILALFDNSYQNSGLIKGLKVKKDGSFSKTCKLLTSDDVEKIINKVDEKINQAKNEILEANFSINPKILEKKNISCQFCQFRDLCFVEEKDFIYLKEKEES